MGCLPARKAKSVGRNGYGQLTGERSRWPAVHHHNAILRVPSVRVARLNISRLPIPRRDPWSPDLAGSCAAKNS